MAGEWETLPLDQLVAPGRVISYGIVQPGISSADGVPIVRVNDVRNGRISTASPMRVSPKIEAAYARTRLQGGELLLSLVGTVGETAVVPASLRGWNTARAVGVIPVRNDIGAYWIQLALRSPAVRHLIDSRLNTTVQATLNLGDVAKLPIVMPPRQEREKIIHILGTLDDKIDLNRQMNETLEAMAKALFMSWFVRFDPVRGKAEGHHSDLSRPIAGLFPNAFENSTLGERPKGWHLETLGDSVSLLRDTINPNAYQGEAFDHFSIPAFDAGKVPACDSGNSIQSQKFVVTDDCVLVSKLNPATPRVWMTPAASARRQVASTEFLVCVGDKSKGMSRELIYCLASSAPFIEYLTTHASGTSNSHQRVRPQDFLQFRWVRPDVSICRAFTELANPFFVRMETNRTQSTTLAALRDTLLPKLISGDLRVKVAERFDSETA